MRTTSRKSSDIGASIVEFALALALIAGTTLTAGGLISTSIRSQFENSVVALNELGGGSHTTTGGLDNECEDGEIFVGMSPGGKPICVKEP